MKLCHSSFTFLLSLLLGIAVQAAPGLPDDFDAFVEEGLKKWNAPGIAVAVVRDDQVILAKGYGVREHGKPEPVDADTLFAIGSTSKAFTSAAVGMLVDAGKLRWEQRVAELWPEFKLSDPWVTGEIRVSDLLANRSGLSALSEMLWYGSPYDRSEIIRRMAFIPLDEGFRYRFQYRNTMFLAAGELLRNVDGRTWDAFIAEEIFTPLGMKRTFSNEEGIDAKENVARPHVTGYEGETVPVSYRPMANIGPAGSIISSISDMTQWLRLHLGNGKVDGRPLLQPGTMAFIHRGHTPLPGVGPNDLPLFPATELSAYGLSWITESYRGIRIIWHNGGIDGMSAWVGFAPEQQFGVVVLTNLETCDLRKAIFYKLLSHVCDLDAEELVPTLLKEHQGNLKGRNSEELQWQKLRAAAKKPAHPLESYVGSYTHPALGTIKIGIEEGALVCQRLGTQAFDLVTIDGDTFLGKLRDPHQDLRSGKNTYTFTVEEGKATRLNEEGIADYIRQP